MSYIGNSPTSVAFPYDTFSGTGSQTAFTMQLAPANTASVLVFVSGVKQDPSTYSVSGTTLTFSAAPPSGTSNISAIYLGIPASGVVNTAYRTVNEATATAGQTSFTVPSYTVGYIDVFRNGVRLNSADYTATTGTTVVLTAGATAGDTVTTESFYISSVLSAIPATNGAVTTPYILDGAVTQAKLAAGVAGNGPAFSAQPSTSQTISNNVQTKVTFNTELFDTNNNFASSTFTPTVSGYYQVNYNIDLTNTSARNYYYLASIYKNGSVYLNYEWTTLGNAGARFSTNFGALVPMNGSTDTIEFYFYSYDYSAGSTITINAASNCSASLARAT